jgi:hypothetical protein
VAPLEVRLVFLDIPEGQRHERIVREEGLDLKRIREIEMHSTEKQVGEVLPRMADLKVTSDRSLDILVREIVGWVHHRNAGNQHAA